MRPKQTIGKRLLRRKKAKKYGLLTKMNILGRKMWMLQNENYKFDLSKKLGTLYPSPSQ